MPVVDLELDDWCSAAFVPNEDALAGLEVVVARRGQDGSGSMVDTLGIAYNVGNPGVRRHAGLIVALAGARRTLVLIAGLSRSPLNAWFVDLSPAARVLEIAAEYQQPLAPTVAGPGAAALHSLYLYKVVLREWPHLPSLRSVAIERVNVEALFPAGAWCPRLEDLRITDSMMELSRVDIQLPLLKRLQMDEAYFIPEANIAVDVPELEDLDVCCEAGYAAADYHSFTLRAPRLRCLTWSDQFAERVHIDVGKPGTVTSGRIQFTSSRAFDYRRKMEDIRAQMMRMLQGLLPDLLPECVADSARPYMSLEKCTVGRPCTGKPVQGEKLTCDLRGLISSLKA
ncbi:unnamed protein product [Urochloa humidicola]